MNLELSETQTLLCETVRSFLRESLPMDRVRACERDDQWDDTLWKDVARQGWLGLAFDESMGGADGSLVDVGLLLEEFARRAAVIPILEVVAAGRVAQAFAPAEVARPLIERILAGDARPVPAVLERNDDFRSVEAAVEHGVLSGAKAYVDYAPFATHHLVLARSSGELGLFLVDAGDSGVSTEALRSIGRTPVGSVRYDGVRVERIGGGDTVESLLTTGRALAAIQCLGSMQEALDQTVAYAKVREQFGKPIGSFQAVRHHCANMAIRIASVRGLCFEALSALDAGRPAAELVASAKASASLAAPEVTMLAHQIHGGNGVIEENDLYFTTLRAKERSLAWGTAEECLADIAREIESETDWL